MRLRSRGTSAAGVARARPAVLIPQRVDNPATRFMVVGGRMFDHGRQTPRGSGLRAALQIGGIVADGAIIPVYAKFTTRGRALVIDRTAYGVADITFKGDTAGMFLVRALHAAGKPGRLFDHFQGDGATLSRICLCPIKRNAKKRTTCTTRQTRILSHTISSGTPILTGNHAPILMRFAPEGVCQKVCRKGVQAHPNRR